MLMGRKTLQYHTQEWLSLSRGFGHGHSAIWYFARSDRNQLAIGNLDSGVSTHPPGHRNAVL